MTESIVTRRGVLGGIAVAGAALVGGGQALAAAASEVFKIQTINKDVPIACVYHCDFATPERVALMAGNINNHLNAYNSDKTKIKIVIVANGPGVASFIKSLEGTPWEKIPVPADTIKTFETLAERGVEVFLCQNSFKKNNLDFSRAHQYPFIKFVESGVMAVGELQSKGFAYIKVG